MKLNKPRLTKLIDFLKQLPEEKFDFNRVIHKCGTVACAIGWTPSVFPDLVTTIRIHGDIRLQLKSGDPEDWQLYPEVAEELFNINEYVAADLFSPQWQHRLHPDLTELDFEATPKEVAQMLEKFIDLVQQGKIEDHE